MADRLRQVHSPLIVFRWMSRQTRLAGSLAVAALLLTALLSTGTSGAAAQDRNPGILPSILSGAEPAQAEAAPAPAGVTFTAKEVVQPLGTKPGARKTGDMASAAPRADEMIAVPDKDYSSLAAMVREVDTSASLDEETRCLATAVFYESRSESLEGQLAVARVIINRAESNRFGEDMCDVVAQPGQFSFVRGGVIPAPNASRPAWKTAIAIARIAQENAWASKAEGALYFHARRVSPSWRRARVAVIDNHIFYR